MCGGADNKGCKASSEIQIKNAGAGFYQVGMSISAA